MSLLDGEGLRGNHSYTNLHRSTSEGSGIFIGDSDNEGDDAEKVERRGSWVVKVSGYPEDYIKTTHMANFYYRNKHIKSHGDLVHENDDINAQCERHSSTSQLAGSK